MNGRTHTALFRLYAELNDLVPPPAGCGRDHTYTWTGARTLQEALVALGVPIDAVELVVVNGESRDLGRALHDGDHVAVYPLFESFDVQPLLRIRSAPLRDVRFACDSQLGRLVRWLRLLGFDTAYTRDVAPHALVTFSRGEHRIVLTRNRRLVHLPEVTHGYFVRSEQPTEQVADVVERFQLHGAMAPFTRCLACNGRLHPVAKSEVLDDLEPKTREVFDAFYRCESCRHIYWHGSHYDRMVVRLKETFGLTLAGVPE